MATLKHLGSKNADYGAAEQYLLFEHDEFTMKPVLDENGRLIPREDYRLSTLNCGGEDFAVACMRSNLRYEKNQRREDVKSHHYIISFDPRDGPDNGLTVDRAQALGEQFCKEHFPGHQALVCTHPDGHNHEKALKHQLKQLTRKERTHRLCIRGGMLESFLQEPERLTDDDVMLLLKLIFHRQDTQELLKKLLERKKPENP